MSSYSPPHVINPIYNPDEYSGASSSGGSNGLLDSGNSKTGIILASTTFTGAYVDVISMSSISIICTASADVLLSADFSTDGVYTDRNIALSDGSSAEIHSLIPIAQFFRISIQNASLSNLTVRCQTILNSNARICIPTSRIAQSINNYSDVLNTRSILSGQYENTNIYGNVGITGQNLLKISLKDPLTGFSELVTSIAEPRIQIDAMYGLLDSDSEILNSTGGTSTSSNSMFYCSTGTNVGGYGVIRSRRLITSNAGQSIRFRFNSLYTTGVANSLQLSGGFNSTNFLGFGYSGVNFGLLRRISGKNEIRKLTISVGTAGNEIHTITLNGTIFTVNTTGILSINQLAEALSEYTSYTGYNATGSPQNTTDAITFIQSTPAVISGAFTYTSNGTGAGTFTTLQTGEANDDITNFIPQTAWNVDTFDGSNLASNPSGILLDPTKLNVYQIVYAFGCSSIVYQIDDGEGHLEIVHIMRYPNNDTIPNQRLPGFKVGWISASLGSIDNLICGGCMASAFTDGMLKSNRYPFTYSVAYSASTTEYVIFSLRVRGEFQNTINLREIQPYLLSAGLVESNRNITIRMYLNPTIILDSTIYTNISTNSCMQYATPTTTTVSGGNLLFSTILAGGNSLNFDLQLLEFRIITGDVIAISLQTSTGSATGLVSIGWHE